jgi:hypothetical protein
MFKQHWRGELDFTPMLFHNGFLLVMLFVVALSVAGAVVESMVGMIVVAGLFAVWLVWFFVGLTRACSRKFSSPWSSSSLRLQSLAVLVIAYGLAIFFFVFFWALTTEVRRGWF